MHTQTDNEKELLILIAKGDEAAFARLVKKYWKHIYSQALSYLKSTQAAEEITQDVFMRLWNARHQLPAVEKVDSYLYIVCRNCVLNALRKRLRSPENTVAPDMAEELLQPDKQLEYREYYEKFLRLIELLPDKRKQVFKMSRLEGRSHEEIASSLGIHKDTVAQYIVKAVNFLRTRLPENTDALFLALLLGVSMDRLSVEVIGLLPG